MERHVDHHHPFHERELSRQVEAGTGSGGEAESVAGDDLCWRQACATDGSLDALGDTCRSLHDDLWFAWGRDVEPQEACRGPAAKGRVCGHHSAHCLETQLSLRPQPAHRYQPREMRFHSRPRR